MLIVALEGARRRLGLLPHSVPRETNLLVVLGSSLWRKRHLHAVFICREGIVPEEKPTVRKSLTLAARSLAAKEIKWEKPRLKSFKKSKSTATMPAVYFFAAGSGI